MSTDHPKNLETVFNNLHINSVPKPRMRSRSLSHITSKCYRATNLGRRKSFILSSRASCCKTDSSFHSVLRPAKLNVLGITKKSSVIRPAKLNVKSSKQYLLKPATLIVPVHESKTLKRSKFAVSCLPTVVSIATDRIFNDDKLSSHSCFKSLVSAEDTEISKAFDALSFKKFRSTMSSSSEPLIANKHENNSSCSIQARMESSVPVDCDETSIEELASYFDLFVHIPKKMSSMAEMMYI